VFYVYREEMQVVWSQGVGNRVCVVVCVGRGGKCLNRGYGGMGMSKGQGGRFKPNVL